MPRLDLQVAGMAPGGARKDQRLQLVVNVTGRAFDRRRDWLRGLIDEEQYAVLRALRDQHITLAEAWEHRKDLTALDLTGRCGSGLWDTTDEQGKTKLGLVSRFLARYEPETAAFYQDSAKRVQKWAPEAQVVADLEHVKWEDLATAWTGKGQTWNHTRQFVGAFLSWHYNDVRHPGRARVMKLIPKLSGAAPRAQAAHMSPDTFERFLELVPPLLVPLYRVVVSLALRIGELYAINPATDLNAHTFQVRLKDRKRGPKFRNAASRASEYRWMPVGETLWPWLMQALAVREQAKREWVWARLKYAARELGLPTLTVHDLRHCAIQWALKSGQDLAQVQAFARHRTAAMTMLYASQPAQQETVNAVAALALPKAKAKHAAVVGQIGTPSHSPSPASVARREARAMPLRKLKELNTLR